MLTPEEQNKLNNLTSLNLRQEAKIEKGIDVCKALVNILTNAFISNEPNIDVLIQYIKFLEKKYHNIKN